MEARRTGSPFGRQQGEQDSMEAAVPVSSEPLPAGDASAQTVASVMVSRGANRQCLARVRLVQCCSLPVLL